MESRGDEKKPLRICVIGGGLAGLCSAYFLSKNLKADVIVLEKNKRIATNTPSEHNAGQICPSHASTMATRSSRLNLLTSWIPWKDSFESNVYYEVQKTTHLYSSLDFLHFGLNFLRRAAQCDERELHDRNRIMVAMATQSQDLLHDTVDTWRAHGYFPHLRSTRSLVNLYDCEAEHEAQLAHGARHGTPVVPIDLSVARATFPAFWEPRFASISTADESSSSAYFCDELARVMENELGVKVHGGERVVGLRKQLGTDTWRVSCASSREVECDAVVFCTGARTARILARLTKAKFTVPIFPLRGWSLSIPLKNEYDGNSDEGVGNGGLLNTNVMYAHKYACVLPARFGAIDDSNGSDNVESGCTRIVRVGGFGEFCTYMSTAPLPGTNRRGELLDFARRCVPKAGALAVERAHVSACHRPLSPDGMPIISALASNTSSHYSSLFVNTGASTLGWTLAMASGLALSNLVALRAHSTNTPSAAFDDAPLLHCKKSDVEITARDLSLARFWSFGMPYKVKRIFKHYYDAVYMTFVSSSLREEED